MRPTPSISISGRRGAAGALHARSTAKLGECMQRAHDGEGRRLLAVTLFFEGSSFGVFGREIREVESWKGARGRAWMERSAGSGHGRLAPAPLSSALHCLLESGRWLSEDSEYSPLSSCCAHCIRLRGCATFELRRDGRCSLANATISDDIFARGLVLELTEYAPRAPGRQLRQSRRRRRSSGGDGGGSTTMTRQPLKLPATCTPWQPFTSAAMAVRCPESAHPERYVLRECGRPGQLAEIAAAQSNELYAQGDCSASCLYHPLTPTTAGWIFDKSGNCFKPWLAHERGPQAIKAPPWASSATTAESDD